MKGEKGDVGLPGAQGPSVSLTLALQWTQESSSGSPPSGSEQYLIFMTDLSENEQIYGQRAKYNLRNVKDVIPVLFCSVIMNKSCSLQSKPSGSVMNQKVNGEERKKNQTNHHLSQHFILWESQIVQWEPD